MIICCGEALIDMIDVTMSDGCKCYQPNVGGSIFNTAIGVGHLGGDVQWLGGLSNDEFASMLEVKMQDSKVGYDYALRSSKPTALAFVSFKDGEPYYRFYDADSAGASIEAVDMPDIPPEAKILHFGGISLVSEPGGSAFESMMRRASRKHLVSFDPNIRPDFIRDEDRYRARLRRMLATSDVVKLSSVDLDWLMPGWDADAVGRQFMSMGASLVFITRGHDSVLAYHGKEKLEVPVLQVEVKDTVGAGDSFNAAVLCKLQSMEVITTKKLKALALEDVKSIAEYAVQVAAKTVSATGALSAWTDSD